MASTSGHGGQTGVSTSALLLSQDGPRNNKRKRPGTAKSKVYAVRVGRAPGIYHTWPECLDQVRGFSKAMFKSFTTVDDAEAYLKDGSNGPNGSSKSKTPQGPITRWHAVQIGKQPGVYTSWNDALAQITGWKGPKYRSFNTQAEAEAYVKGGITPAANGGDGPATKKAKASKSRKSVVDESGPAETGEYKPGEQPLPDDASDGFDTAIVLDNVKGGTRYKTDDEIQAHKPMAVRPTKDSAIRIYTDGSSLGNGRLNAMGGVGVFFGPGDKRNLSEPLPGTRQTNQRAELTAILRALEVAPSDRKCVIVSDSHYAIMCCTQWFQAWRSNNWYASNGKPVENKDLVQKIVDMLEERYRINRHRVAYDDEGATGEAKGHWEQGPASVKFEWVKGHDKDAGNAAADRLAVAGAREAQELGGRV